MKLGLYIGNLVDGAIGAHAIVNASNPNVALGSGVSGAIRKACGEKTFQQEVRERFEDEFDTPLEPGDCLVTSAGTSTAFRWVLHVPSVDYRKRDPETGGNSGPTRVGECTRAFLDAAALLARENDLTGKFILATPLLGAGAGGMGAIKSMDVMMSVLSDRLKSPEQRDGLAKLIFVVLEPKVADLVEKCADKYNLRIERQG